MDDTVCSKSLTESQTKPDIQRLRSLFLNVINGGEREENIRIDRIPAKSSKNKQSKTQKT